MDVGKKLVLQGYGVTFATIDNINMPPSIEQNLVLRPLEQPILFQKGFLLKRGRQLPSGADKLIKFVKGKVEELQTLQL